jgi:hypothetical protein
LFINKSNRFLSSGFNCNPFFNGNNLTSVRDGDISAIHKLSAGASLPTLLLSNVICVLNIQLSYPASLKSLSTSIKYSVGN